jgi:hypothetical protein
MDATERSMNTTAKILVTGDYGFDYDIYLPSDEDNPPPGTPAAQIEVSVGGAGVALRILNAAAAHLAAASTGSTIEVGFCGKPDQVTAPPTAALWQKFKFGKLGKTPDDEEQEVWRVRRSLSLGTISDMHWVRPAIPQSVADDFRAEVVLIEDNVGKFRFQVPDWLPGTGCAEPGHLAKWIVLKTSAPICHGAFWWELSRSAEFRDRTVVLASIRDLRRLEIRVSQGISWERTALDLARELSQSPLLEGLRRARHVIVSLQGEGALWMQRAEDEKDGNRQFSFELLFDPGCMEGDWPEEMCGPGGNAYGFQSTLAAAIAAHMALSDQDGLRPGIENGLRAMRLLRAMGHGLAGEGSLPQLPAAALAAVVLGDLEKPSLAAPKMPPADLTRLGAFGNARIPATALPGGSTDTQPGAASQCQEQAKWRILEASDSRATLDQPLYGLGRRVALLGLDGLRKVPYASFGKLFTADRDEIEALRNIQRLMQDYENNKTETKPLSIAVFGPPGSGKSFGIKQIAETALRGSKPFLEFNLAQFEDPRDLIGAFHQVRDKVLEGGLPVVFWDEFDSHNYKWLQYLLAPMQDGKFHDGQITHPIGRCVFVFAGGTCFDSQSFGPPDKLEARDEEALREHKQAIADFRLKKGPDFKSRLHGYLNVLGPNQRQLFIPANPPGEQWVDDATDVCFPVRRAILLRSWLGLMDPKKKQSRKRLDMDSGLLAALIEVDHYHHGARSMEKIVMTVKRDGKGGYHRSALPSNEVLEMNIKEPARFLEIMDQPRAFQRHAWRLAPAIHAAWAELADQENAYKTGFDKLPEEAKGDNYAAALRIPLLLGLVGLQLVEEHDKRPAVSDVEAILENHLELLAEEEHTGWMEVKIANGWEKAPLPKDKDEEKAQRAVRQTHCLVRYAELGEPDKDKDRKSIRNIPAVATMAQFKIVAREPSDTEYVKYREGCLTSPVRAGKKA